MKILTKKYRLIWDNGTKEIIGDPLEEHIDSETIVGKGLLAFESNEVEDIIEILDNSTLTINDETT